MTNDEYYLNLNLKLNCYDDLFLVEGGKSKHPVHFSVLCSCSLVCFVCSTLVHFLLLQHITNTLFTADILNCHKPTKKSTGVTNDISDDFTLFTFPHVSHVSESAYTIL